MVNEETPRVRVEMISKTYQKMISPQQVLKAREKLITKRMKSRRSHLRFLCHPNSTLRVEHISSTLKTWCEEGWVPDVVVIDYADILAMDQPGYERRDQIDRCWRLLRRMSQEFHCLVVTATQTNAASYSVKTLKSSHFSEDKRKLAHVTGFIGLNTSPYEDKRGIMRLNWVLRREGESDSHRSIYVAGCKAIANPAIISKY